MCRSMPRGYAVYTCPYLRTRVQAHEYDRTIYCLHPRGHNQTAMHATLLYFIRQGQF